MGEIFVYYGLIFLFVLLKHRLGIGRKLLGLLSILAEWARWVNSSCSPISVVLHRIGWRIVILLIFDCWLRADVFLDEDLFLFELCWDFSWL
jgi:hypothetical protein